MHDVNVYLHTARFLDVTKDIILSVLAYLKEDDRVIFTIGDGQCDDEKLAWIRDRASGFGDRFKYIVERDLWERVRQSLNVEATWMLWLADDDPITVNYLRSLVDKACASGDEVSAVFPAFYLSYSKDRVYALRFDDMDQASQGERLSKFFFTVSHNGLLSYSAVRREHYRSFFDYIRQRPIQPSYCDHLIASLLVMTGRVIAARGNVSVLVRDDSVWYETGAETDKDASLYPRREMVLFHDLFWMADLLNLLRGNGLAEDAHLAVYKKIKMHLNVLVERFELRLGRVGVAEPQMAVRSLEMMRPLLERCWPAELDGGPGYLKFFDEVVDVSEQILRFFGSGAVAASSPAAVAVTAEETSASEPAPMAVRTSPPADYANICVITYNRLDFTKQALASIFAHTDYPHLVTVVDNGSTDGSVAYLKELHAAGKIRNLVLFEHNVGVAKAANVGWACEPSADFYLKFDNDIIMQGPWLADLVDMARSIPSAGTVGYNVEPYSYPLSQINGKWVRIKHNGNLGGACKLIPRHVHERFGFWSEEYGLYGEEDADYGYRIIFGGLQNIYMKNESLAFHLPAGKAAIIDPVTFEAKDGQEEELHADYRRWKDKQRKSNASRGGLFLENLQAYRSGQKSLYVDSQFVSEWRSKRFALYRYEGSANAVETTEVKSLSSFSIQYRIVVYSGDRQSDACAQIRLLQPFKHLNPKLEILWGVKDKADGGHYSDLPLADKADVILLQRYYVMENHRDYIEQILASGRPVVFEMDDLLFDLPPDHVHFQLVQPNRELILSVIDRVDAVIVSTPSLADALKTVAHPKQVYILPNAIESGSMLRQPVVRQGAVRIALTGTPTHRADMAVVDKALEKVIRKYGRKVQLVFMGDTPEHWRKHPAVTSVEFVKDYLLYARTLPKFEFDIALVPLLDNPFNRCKSHIKWLEYSVAGIAGVFSDLPPYAEIKNGVTGIKVANTTDAWFEAICDLIDHPDKRLAIAQTSQAEVLAHHTHEARAEEYRRVYSEIAASRPRETKGVVQSETVQDQESSSQLYEVWQAAHAPQPRDAEWVAERLRSLAKLSSFHIGVIALAENEVGLATTIESLGQQFNGDWRLTIVAESPAPDALEGQDKICWLVAGEKPALAILNQALLDTPADWVGMVEAGDRLAPHALFTLADTLDRRPNWQLVYSDEDSLDGEGKRDLPFFKTDFNLEMLRAAPFTLGGLILFRHGLFAELGGYQVELEGAENYDLALRAWERCGNDGVGHVSDILYHRFISGGHSRREPEIIQVAKRVALDEHFLRLGIKAEYEDGRLPGTTWVRYQHEAKPLVSIIIPTRNQVHFLQRCLESLIEKTIYSRYEILVVDNGSDDPQAISYLATLRRAPADRMRVIEYPGAFNFSAMNNRGAQEARGDYLLLLNNDTAVLEGDWLDEMLAMAQLPDVGIVGARLLFPNGKIQHAGVILGINDTVADHPFIDHAADEPGYFGRLMLPQELSAVTAACMLVRKSVFEQVGGLDEEDFKVSYNDVDFCLRVREQGFRIIWTPYATLLHEGSASQTQKGVEQTEDAAKKARFRAEREAMYQKWSRWIAFDPAYNRNLSSVGRDFLVELAPPLTWDPEWRPRPRVLAHPADRMGCGEYRVISPMRALNEAGMTMGWETGKYLSVPELLRMDPDSILFQRQIEWSQIELMESYIRHSKAFRIFEIDDLITNIPVKSSRKKAFVEQKDLIKRFRKAVSLCHRFVVSTDYLAEEYRGYTDEVLAVPNFLERSRWDGLKPERRQGDKPRVGWAGSTTHDGDLHEIIDVVKATADEVDWVFFGMCPAELRPLIKEFHAPVALDDYAAKLATLNLDLAVAPLEDVPFNHGKSHLRLLEYGVMGYPVICTDITPYRGAYPVTRVPNKYKHWVEAIREHLSDMDELARRGDALREHIQANWMLEDNLDLWLKAWQPS